MPYIDEVAHRVEHDDARAIEAGIEVDGADDRFVQARREPHPTATSGVILAPSETRALRES